MKCPECVRLGLKSTLHGGDSVFTTCGGWSSYYDEDGRYHNHDPNWSSTTMRCSNGHLVSLKTRNKCRACDYGGEKEIKVIEICQL